MNAHFPTSDLILLRAWLVNAKIKLCYLGALHNKGKIKIEKSAPAINTQYCM